MFRYVFTVCAKNVCNSWLSWGFTLEPSTGAVLYNTKAVHKPVVIHQSLRTFTTLFSATHNAISHLFIGQLYTLSTAPINTMSNETKEFYLLERSA